MRPNTDDLIHDNLNLLINSPNMSMYYTDMYDSDGIKFNLNNGEHFVSFLIYHGLVTKFKERVDITLKGIDICKQGGWKTYLKNQYLESEQRKSYDNYKSKLQLRNLELQNESSEYQKSIRKQQEKINHLTVKNLSLQNKQLRRFIIYSIIAFLSGAILTNIKDIYYFIFR